VLGDAEMEDGGSSDGDEDTEDESEEEESEPADEDVVLRDKIASALKEAGLDAEASSDDDEDEEGSEDGGAEEVLLDDDQMFQLDERLATIFRERKSAKANDKGTENVFIQGSFEPSLK
jgi:DNA polymerase phi